MPDGEFGDGDPPAGEATFRPAPDGFAHGCELVAFIRQRGYPFCLAGAGVAGCPMTAPGGYCDPDGDGDLGDADWVRGWREHHALCGAASP